MIVNETTLRKIPIKNLLSQTYGRSRENPYHNNLVQHVFALSEHEPFILIMIKIFSHWPT